MVKLRLKRMGSKFNAFYRIVAADARAPRDGKFIEEVGYYNPHTKEIKINQEIKAKWLAQGAVPSETVQRLFKKAELISKTDDVIQLPKKVKKVKKSEVVVEKEQEAPAPATEAKAETTNEESAAKEAEAPASKPEETKNNEQEKPEETNQEA